MSTAKHPRSDDILPSTRSKALVALIIVVGMEVCCILMYPSKDRQGPKVVWGFWCE
jgi:hypothetical protein